MLYFIRICSHNVNRIESKYEEIKHNLMFSDNQPDVLGLCETFLTKHTTDNELQVPGYVFERKDRTSQGGGGLIVYFSETIKFLRKNNIEIGGTETMWFEIKPDYKKSFLLCFVYRPPKSLIDWVYDFEKEIRVAMTMNSDITL